MKFEHMEFPRISVSHCLMPIVFLVGKLAFTRNYETLSNSLLAASTKSSRMWEQKIYCWSCNSRSFLKSHSHVFAARTLKFISLATTRRPNHACFPTRVSSSPHKLAIDSSVAHGKISNLGDNKLDYSFLRYWNSLRFSPQNLIGIQDF